MPGGRRGHGRDAYLSEKAGKQQWEKNARIEQTKKMINYVETYGAKDKLQQMRYEAAKNFRNGLRGHELNLYDNISKVHKGSLGNILAMDSILKNRRGNQKKKQKYFVPPQLKNV